MKVISMKILILALFSILFAGCGSTLQNLQTKANEGDVKSQFDLGNLYYFGSKEVKEDKEKAMHYYQLAEKSGNVEAQYSLGQIADKNKEYEKAVYYYQKAAEKEFAYAQSNLGILYKHGRGVPKDIEEAKRLFTKAYQNGDIFGLRNLGSIYREVTKENDKAKKIFQELLFSKTDDKDNPIQYKQFVCLELMNMNYDQALWEEAYIWGSITILSGWFDGKTKEPEKHLKTFEMIKSKLSKERQQTLAKEIHYNYYHAFQKYMYYYRTETSLHSEDGVSIESNKHLLGFAGFLVMQNKELYAEMNYFKSKNDDISKINYAFANLKFAMKHIEYGSISPFYYSAIKEINESLEILNQYNYPNLDYTKDVTNKKLEILQDVYSYYTKQYELKRAALSASK